MIRSSLGGIEHFQSNTYTFFENVASLEKQRRRNCMVLTSHKRMGLKFQAVTSTTARIAGGLDFQPQAESKRRYGALVAMALIDGRNADEALSW